MGKKVLVPIADGTEEIEATCIIDTLRRAGAEVIVASVGQPQVTASRGVKLVADARISDCMNETFDCVVLPGGATTIGRQSGEAGADERPAHRVHLSSFAIDL